MSHAPAGESGEHMASLVGRQLPPAQRWSPAQAAPICQCPDPSHMSTVLPSQRISPALQPSSDCISHAPVSLQPAGVQLPLRSVPCTG